MHFIGKTHAAELGVHAVIRLSPMLHMIGDTPPTPEARSTIEIETASGRIVAEIRSSRSDRLILQTQDRRWGATPIRPDEFHDGPAFEEVSGAVDWIIRCAG